MTLKEKIKSEMTAAMKAKDSERLKVIRLLWSALRKEEIDTKTENLEDADIQKLFLKHAKQSKESLAQATELKRTQDIEELNAELKVVHEFLPAQMDASAVASEVNKVLETLKSSGTMPEGPRALGLVMKEVMQSLKGKADGKLIQEQVKTALNL